MYSNKPEEEEETGDWDDDLFTEADMTYPSEEYYRLCLPMDRVHVVTTLDDLHSCQENVVKVQFSSFLNSQHLLLFSVL